MVSQPRVRVLEALEAQGKEGATIEEMVLLVGSEFPGNRPQGSIGQVLGYMKTDEIVVFERGRWFLTEYAPSAPQPDLHINGLNTYAPVDNGKVAPITQKRKGIVISVYTSPRVYEQAIDIALLIGGRWWPVPLFGNARICIGQSRPEWSPNERYYTDVEVVKITQQGGKISEERPAPKDIVTIDQAEE